MSGWQPLGAHNPLIKQHVIDKGGSRREEWAARLHPTPFLLWEVNPTCPHINGEGAPLTPQESLPSPLPPRIGSS